MVIYFHKIKQKHLEEIMQKIKEIYYLLCNL